MNETSYRKYSPGEARQEATPPPDPIKHPAHYTAFPVQPIELAAHLPFCLGSALKYIVRAGRKGDAVEDLRKAARFIEMQIELIETGKVSPR